MKLESSVLWHGVAGFTAGTVATAAVYPLDLVRTRLQIKGALAHGRFEYSNSFTAMAAIVRTCSARAVLLRMVCVVYFRGKGATRFAHGC